MQLWQAFTLLAIGLTAMGVAAGAISVIAWRISRALTEIDKVVPMSVQNAVDTVVAQIRKGTTEVVAKIADLQAKVDAGEAVDLSELAAAAQALDDIVPDVPVEVPDEVPADVDGDEVAAEDPAAPAE